MIKASIKDAKTPIIIAGLSEQNILRLKAGRMVLTELKSFGVDLPGKLAIVYGQSEQTIFEEMKKADLIDRCTIVHNDPKLDAQAAIERRSANLLIATVGLPRSGKTTWARSQGYPIVSPDAIRLVIHGQRFIKEKEDAVWLMAWQMVKALFTAGHRTVILDATNNTWKRRQELLSLSWDLVFKVIPTPADACIARAKEIHDEEIIPVIERMAAEHEPLGEGEVEWP